MNGILGFGRARNEIGAKKWKWGQGERKEENACRQTPRFWKPAFASERSAWLARLVEQCWHLSIKGLFHTERMVWYVTRILLFSGCCLFWSARFALQYKNIFFDLFWNVRLFLRLNKGFRSFNLFSSWITKSDFLLFANAMVSCNVSCWTQLVGVSFFGGIQMLNSLRWSFTDCSVRRNKKTNVQSLYWLFGLIDISILTPSTCYKKIQIQENIFGFTYASSEVHFHSTESQTFYWSSMTADDSIKCRYANSGKTGKWAVFKIPGFVCKCFLRFCTPPPPSPPRSFTYAIFRAIFDSRSSFFAPKLHGNACYAG